MYQAKHFHLVPESDCSMSFLLTYVHRTAYLMYGLLTYCKSFPRRFITLFLFHQSLKKTVTFVPLNVTFVTPVRARQAHASQPKPTEIRKKRNSSGAASPLNRLAIAARIPKLLFPFLYIRISVAFRHLPYHVFAYRAHIATFVPAAKVIIQKKFLILHSKRTNNIFVHHI